MKIASIDIGSNTVLLLIADITDGKLNPIYNQYETPRLGKGLGVESKINDEKIVLLLQILKNFKTKIEEFNCDQIIIKATNAMRIAKNSTSIIELVKNELDLIIEIIEGEEEARLSFLGASSAQPDLNKIMVIDIGGGSTEIIYGNKTEIQYRKSFQVGTVSLTEKFLTSFPYSVEKINQANEFITNTFEPLITSIPKSIPCIAVAGTPTTLACMMQNLNYYSEENVENYEMTEFALEKLSHQLSSLSGDMILNKYGKVVSGREDVIFAGSLILHGLQQIKKLKIIYVSGHGLRYGSIIDYIT